MATQSSGALPSVGAVALKLPPFWPESLEVWFTQAEAQFNIKGMSSSTTKFYHCVASTSQEVASQMLDLIRAPPASEPYEVLKARLVKTYSLKRVWFLFHSLAIRSRLTLWTGCSPCSRRITSLASFYKVWSAPFTCRCSGTPLTGRYIWPCALSLKEDELYYSHVSSSVNILSSEETLDPQIVIAVWGPSSASRGHRSSVPSTFNYNKSMSCFNPLLVSSVSRRECFELP